MCKIMYRVKINAFTVVGTSEEINATLEPQRLLDIFQLSSTHPTFTINR